MGDRYELSLRCAYCGELNEDVYYAPSSGFETFRCNRCNEINEIVMEFSAIKREDVKQQKEDWEREIEKEDKMEDVHNHGVTSNTQECFRTFLGHTLKGLVFDSQDSVWLIFDCGAALVLSHHSTYWTVLPEEVKRQINYYKQKLEETKKDLQDVIFLAEGDGDG